MAFRSLHQKIYSRTTLPAVNRKLGAADKMYQLSETAHRQAPANLIQHPAVHIEVELPDDLALFRLPDSVQQRLNTLLDKQDAGHFLTEAERREAEGLVNLADLLSLLRVRAERVSDQAG
jgi:hypothetical protein